MNTFVQNSPFLLGGIWVLVILFTLCRQDKLAAWALTVFGATVGISAIGYLAFYIYGVIPSWHRAIYLVSFPLACVLVWRFWPQAVGREDRYI